MFVFRWFNGAFEWVRKTYVGHIGSAISNAPRWMILFVVIVAICGWLFTRLPGSFLPEEDQGYGLAIVQLPPGATFQRTAAVMDQVQATLEKQDGFEGMMRIIGFSFVGQGENVGMAFVRLKPWDDRKIIAAEFIQKANGALSSIRDAQIFVVNLPTVRAFRSSAASTCICRIARARDGRRSPKRATHCSRRPRRIRC